MAAGTVTELLLAWRAGDEPALARLTPLVHDELQRIARRCLRGERAGHTLQATALVNEAYMRMIDARRVDWQNRAHFFAIAATLMRRILVDARAAGAATKAGRRCRRMSLDEHAVAAPGATTWSRSRRPRPLALWTRRSRWSSSGSSAG